MTVDGRTTRRDNVDLGTRSVDEANYRTFNTEFIYE